MNTGKDDKQEELRTGKDLSSISMGTSYVSVRNDMMFQNENNFILKPCANSVKR
jgi:hypothetical protein